MRAPYNQLKRHFLVGKRSFASGCCLEEPEATCKSVKLVMTILESDLRQVLDNLIRPL